MKLRVFDVIRKIESLVKESDDKKRIEYLTQLLRFVSEHNGADLLIDQYDSLLKRRRIIMERAAEAAYIYGSENPKLIARERNRVYGELGFSDVNRKIKQIQEVIFL